MKITKFFFMSALALTFAACSSDDTDLLIPDQPLTTDGIPFKATISTGTSGTRGLTPAGNDLVATWEVGEKVALIHNGVKDVMRVSSVDGDGVATIEGTITGDPEDGAAVTIIYPATAANGATGDVLANLLCFQTSGTLDDVAAKYDVRKGNGTLKVDGTASLNGNVSLDNQNAIFKFTIKNAAGSATIDIKVLAATIGTTTYVTTPASATSELYFVLPAVSDQKVSFAATNDGNIYAFSKTVTFAAGKYYQSTLKMSETDVLPGKFTINGSGDQINFSKGNLQATTTDNGANWTWAFADHQYDYVGNAAANTSINGNGTISANGTVDLFGWVGASSTWTGEAQYGISNSTSTNNTNGYGNSATESLKSDWGSNIGEGWYTLSKDEWVYLFNTRTVNGGTGAGHSYTLGQSVNGKLGVVIYPDNYTGAAYAGSNWSTFEAAGCVFLPAAGSRDGSTVYDAGSYGSYWSSSPYASNVNIAYRVLFSSGDLDPAYSRDRYYGYSVRLVR